MNVVDQLPSPRVPLTLEVEYRRSYGRNADTGLLRNISLTGAFLEHGTVALKSSDKVAIVFKVGGRSRKVAATIVWSNDAGSGVMFHPANNRDVQIVDDLIYFVESKRENKKSVLDDIFKQAA
jgi:hypothetical protein